MGKRLDQKRGVRGNRLSPRQISGHFPRVLVWLGLWCLCGCSLKDYGYLSEDRGAGDAANTGAGGTSGDVDSLTGGRTGDGGSAHAGEGAGAEGGSAPANVGPGGSGQQVTCDSGLTFCPGEEECIDLAQGEPSGSTFNHCGACGTVCSEAHATDVECDNGECVPTCTSGFADCNSGALNDGCETDIIATASHCGECGRACSNRGARSTFCVVGACAPVCSPSYADCSRDDGDGEDDGCEVFVDQLENCGRNCKGEGVSCPATQVCNAGSCGAAQGMVVFNLPLTGAGQEQRYGALFAALPDLTNNDLFVRAYAPGAKGGTLRLYAMDASFRAGAGVSVPLSTLSDGWIDVSLPIGGISGAHDPSQVYQLTIEILSGGSGPWTNPTILYVDRVRSSSGNVDYTFDSSILPMVESTVLVVEGSEMTWLEAVPDSGAGGAGAGSAGAGGAGG